MKLNSQIRLINGSLYEITLPNTYLIDFTQTFSILEHNRKVKVLSVKYGELVTKMIFGVNEHKVLKKLNKYLNAKNDLIGMLRKVN